MNRVSDALMPENIPRPGRDILSSIWFSPGPGTRYLVLCMMGNNRQIGLQGIITAGCEAQVFRLWHLANIFETFSTLALVAGKGWTRVCYLVGPIGFYKLAVNVLMAVSFWISKILFLLVLFHCLEGQLCYWKEGPEEFAVVVLHLENWLRTPSAEIWTSHERWESYAPGHLHCELFIKWFLIICWFIIFQTYLYILSLLIFGLYIF